MTKRKHVAAGFERELPANLYRPSDWKKLPFKPEMSCGDRETLRRYDIIRNQVDRTISRWGMLPEYYPKTALTEQAIDDSLRECKPLFQAAVLGTGVLTPLAVEGCLCITRKWTRHLIRQTKVDALVQEMDEQGNMVFRTRQIMREQFIREAPAGDDSPTDYETFDPIEYAASDSTGQYTGVRRAVSHQAT